MNWRNLHESYGISRPYPTLENDARAFLASGRDYDVEIEEGRVPLGYLPGEFEQALNWVSRNPADPQSRMGKHLMTAKEIRAYLRALKGSQYRYTIRIHPAMDEGTVYVDGYSQSYTTKARLMDLVGTHCPDGWTFRLEVVACGSFTDVALG